MNIINKLTLKYLKMNKKRSYITVIGIILVSTLLFSIGIATSTVKKISIDEVKKSEGINDVLFKNIPYTNIDKLKENNNIAKIIYFQNTDMMLFDSKKNSDGIIINFINTNDNFKSYVNLIEGYFPNNQDEIIISSILVQNELYKIGDELNNKKIVGIYDDNTLFVNNYINDGSTYYVYTNDKDKNLNTNFFIIYKSLKNIYNKIYTTADELGLNYYDNYNTKEYQSTNINNSWLMINGQYPNNITDSLKLTSTIILTILSAFSLIIIYNSFSISLTERKKYIGTLRSLGASKKQIFKSVVLETFITSLIGIPIGFILSLGFTEIIILIVNRILINVSNVTFALTLYPSYMILSLLFLLITIFVSALFPAIKASNISPMAAIRLSYDFDIDYSKENNKIIRKLLGEEGELAYKNIKRNGGKYNVVIFSLAISIVLFIIFSTYIKIAYVYSSYLMDNGYDITISVYDSDRQNQIVDEIANISSIDKIVISKSMYLYYDATDKKIFTDEAIDEENGYFYNPITVIGLDEKSYNEYKKRIKLTDNSKIILYNKENITTDTVYVDNSILDNSNNFYNVFKNGDMSLNFSNIDIVEYKLKDRGIKDSFLSLNNFYLTDTSFDCDYCGASIIVDLNKYNEIAEIYSKYALSTDYKKINININSKKTEKFDKDIKYLTDDVDNNISYYNRSLDNYNQQMKDLAVIFILYSALGFITLIVITTIYNVINTNVQLRRREFSRLRSIGLSNKGINKIIIFESMFLSYETLIYAIPFALLIIYYISYTFKLIANYNDFKILFPTEIIVISIIGTFLIVLAIMWHSFKFIKKANIIDTIRDENV